jgi:hypothetical protein
MNRFKYTIHNLVGHPLMEVFYILGFTKWAKWIHDKTLPKK